MKFAIIDRTDYNSIQQRNEIKKQLMEHGLEYDEKYPDLVICVGGDGTFLRAIHQYIDILDTTMFVGIHTGTLGFLTDFTQREINELIHLIVHTTPVIENRPMLKIEFKDKEEVCYALNEVRISSMDRTLKLDIYIDDEFFEQTSGSGICVSTQVGSSALNRALNGAVVDPGLDVLQLCEIMPVVNKNHHSLQNPYIMKETRKLTIKGEFLHYANINYDHLSANLEDVNEILISSSTKKVRFARYRTYSYLKRLKNLY
ncbi:NAD kinase [Floccifex sp.]|uniref:NAD kinase n=1 Tax=Floccifex sp. TaxID=2815810 RepID=UPI002A75283E|nr:NAD kinase [Floccifex sp.]MDD7280482.1 NAD kinase [Erysipelotrichaceae bacterium]MDY2958671.1 NAD kinase [Floccifex sp.]